MTTIMALEEQARGWLGRIKQVKSAGDTVHGDAKLQRFFDVAARWTVLPFDEGAVETFNGLRAQGKRIGTMDLRIAATALTHRGRLLSRQINDFKRLPDLQVEDWLHEC